MTELKINVSIPNWAVFPWESQARQYPRKSKPGIAYHRYWEPEECPDPGCSECSPIDTLLYYDAEGMLRGILNLYPEDIYEHGGPHAGELLEYAGNFNIWVDPDHYREGVATALMTEAFERWPDINLAQQRWTPKGAKFIAAFMIRKEGKP